jgi:hypothetical protein
MAAAKTVSLTLPLAMIEEAERRAKLENRTVSEFVAEALRRYERSLQLDEFTARARAAATELGITEADVPALVKEFRREQRRNQ